MTPKQALRRYFKIFVPSMVAYLASIFGLAMLRIMDLLTGWYSYALPLIPGICVVVFMWGHFRFIKECDELQRRVLVEAMMFGLFIALTVSTVWGLIEMFSDVPRLGVFWIFPIFYGGYGLASAYLTRKYDMSCQP